MDNLEREAVLSLVPYFEKRIIFDVGSNMGEWTDILVHNMEEVHLFEPNLKLLHYTEIKYRYLRNVKYHNCGVAEQFKVLQYNEFSYEFNGLSSLFYNERWADLPQQAESIEVIRLDSLDVEFVDFLKIDVEGAEWDVIRGAENLFKEKKIKFIQIEYSEHYKVPGYRFQDVIDLMTKYGYQLFDYNGEWFKPDFVENYERHNYYFMQEFTENWNMPLKKNTKGMKFTFALEVGSFEGLSSCYICDTLLKKGGRLICVDPLQDVYLTTNLDKEAHETNKELTGFKGQYDRFIRNTKNKPVELKRMTSQQAYQSLSQFKFDFIYIDGDHRENAVNADANLYWNLVNDQGGIMLFDDYEWSDGTKKGIDRFLADKAGQYKILVKDYQVMVKKWV
ncbi:MAG: FkbM family methyltransferase [Bacteroidetes bacterium]|nr:FkbM family methyltransferase [Bacteroidota bacterium]